MINLGSYAIGPAYRRYAATTALGLRQGGPLALGLAVGPVAVCGFAHRCVALKAGTKGTGHGGQRAGHPGDLR